MNILALQVANLTDARYFAAMGTSYIGFKIGPNAPLSLIEIAAIIEWVEGPELLLEFETDDINIIEKHIIELAPKAILAKENILDKLKDNPSLLKGILSTKDQLSDLPDYVDFVILNLTNEDLDDIENLNKILKSKGEDVFLDTNIPFSQFKEVIHNIESNGLVVRGGEEEKVGVKSYEEIDEIFDFFEED